jgi:hypothetical protein
MKKLALLYFQIAETSTVRMFESAGALTEALLNLVMSTSLLLYLGL